MAITRGPSIVRDGLVLCLDAKDPNSYSGSGSTWYDLTTTSNNASLTSVNYNSNGYFDFPASTGSQVGLGSTITLSSAMTFEMMCNPDDLTIDVSGYRSLFSAGNGNRIFVSNSGQIFARIGGTNVPISANSAVTTSGGWFSIVVTWTGSFYACYINNSSSGSGASNTGYISDFKYIGNYGSDNGRFDGQIAYLRLYDRVLSSNELTENYNAQKSRFGL